MKPQNCQTFHKITRPTIFKNLTFFFNSCKESIKLPIFKSMMYIKLCHSLIIFKNINNTAKILYYRITVTILFFIIYMAQKSRLFYSPPLPTCCFSLILIIWKGFVKTVTENYILRHGTLIGCLIL